MVFKYELVQEGGKPTWDKDFLETFQNPVHVGEKVKAAAIGSSLLTVVAVEHYPTCSVLYYAVQ